MSYKYYKYLNLSDDKLTKLLIKEKIDEEWIRELLLGKKGLRSEGGQIEVSLIDRFKRVVWDNLSPKQQLQVIEATNKILEEDLFKEIHRREDYANIKDEKELPDPFYEGSYWDYLVDLTCMLEGKMPGLIKKETLLKWREENYPNFRTDVSKRSVNEKVEATFLPKEYNRRLLDSPSTFLNEKPRRYVDGKEATKWEYVWINSIKSMTEAQFLKSVSIINELLQENIAESIKHKEGYLVNLLESCCVIEREKTGFIKKEKVLGWYKSGYAGINFDEETKNKLNKLIEEYFLKGERN